MLQKYQEWKDSLPDLSWLDEVLPNNEQMTTIQKSLKSIVNTVKNIDFSKIAKLFFFIVEELKCVKK